MIVRRVVVPADPGRLWRALTDPSEAGGWLGGELEWTLGEGEALRFTPAGGAGGDRESVREVRESVWEGRVEAVVPGRYLRFVWWPAGDGASPADGMADQSATQVAYELEPVVADGPDSEPATILTVREAPLVPAARVPAVPARARAGLASGGEGWTWLDDLQLLLWSARRHAFAS